MNRFFSFAFALLLFAACSQQPTAVIEASIEGADQAQIVLQKLNFSKIQVVDTIKTAPDGSFTYKVKLSSTSPGFYYLYHEGTKLASMVLLPKDKVTINADLNGNFTVTGSEESLLLQAIDKEFLKTSAQLSDLAGKSVDGEDVGLDMGRTYIEYRKTALKHIFGNPHSITAATTLFQRFNDNLPVFGEISDFFIFKQVYDSLKTVYPQSEYVLALKDEITARERAFELTNKLSNVQEALFPDLEMPDNNGDMKRLSDFTGNVIILSFWSVAQDAHKMFNNDLAELYQKYHSEGLEVYQVSLDIDKASWASIVRSQQLPWTSVNDGNGINSPSMTAYNITQIPTFFVIGRDGTIAGKDLFEKDKLEKVIKAQL
jgi:peroxiredoxin